MNAEDAYRILECIAKISGTEDRLNRMKPEGHEILDEEIAEEVSEISKERLAPFRFSKCNIQPGETIEFYNDSTLKITVVDDKTVEYEGKTYSLSALAKILSESKGNVAGPRYFKYKGEWLNDVRARVDEEYCK